MIHEAPDVLDEDSAQLHTQEDDQSNPQVTNSSESTSSSVVGEVQLPLVAEEDNVAKSNPAEVTPEGSVEGMPSVVPEELRGMSEAEVVNEVGRIEGALESMTPEQKERVGWGINNFGFKVEQFKNSALGGAFSVLSERVGEKGTFGRFLSALGSNYAERNKELEVRQQKMQETGKGALLHGASVVGGVLRWGRVLSDATGWTAGAPLKGVQLAATLAETGFAAAKEARLSNEEVMEETRVQDIDQAAEEAWTIYESAMKKQGESGDMRNGITAESLKKAYSEQIPQDLLRRLEEHPVEGTGSSLVQKIFRKHIELSARSVQKKLDAIESASDIAPEAKEHMKEKVIEGWGRSKMLKDYDRMLSQQGAVDALAMSSRYATGAAKAASIAMMGQSVKLLWDKFADVLASGSAAVAEVPALSYDTPDASFEGRIDLRVQDSEPSSLEYTDTDPDQVTKDFSSGESVESQQISPELPAQGATSAEEQSAEGNISPKPEQLIAGDPEWSEGASPAKEPLISGDPNWSEGFSPTGEPLIPGDPNWSEGASLPTQEGVLSYDVQKGDNLTKILKAKLPGTSDADIVRLDKYVRGLSAEEVKKLGLSSNDINKIFPGEKINVSAIGEIIKSTSSEQIANNSSPFLRVEMENPITSQGGFEDPDRLLGGNGGIQKTSEDIIESRQSAFLDDAMNSTTGGVLPDTASTAERMPNPMHSGSPFVEQKTDDVIESRQSVYVDEEMNRSHTSAVSSVTQKPNPMNASSPFLRPKTDDVIESRQSVFLDNVMNPPPTRPTVGAASLPRGGAVIGNGGTISVETENRISEVSPNEQSSDPRYAGRKRYRSPISDAVLETQIRERLSGDSISVHPAMETTVGSIESHQQITVDESAPLSKQKTYEISPSEQSSDPRYAGRKRFRSPISDAVLEAQIKDTLETRSPVIASNESIPRANTSGNELPPGQQPPAPIIESSPSVINRVPRQENVYGRTGVYGQNPVDRAPQIPKRETKQDAGVNMRQATDAIKAAANLLKQFKK